MVGSNANDADVKYNHRGAIYEYQSWNEQPLIDLLKKIW